MAEKDVKALSFINFAISYYLFYWLYFISVNVDLYVPQIIEGSYNVIKKKKYSSYEGCDNNPCIVKPADSSPIKISLPIKTDLDEESKKYECRSLNGCLKEDIDAQLSICTERGLTKDNTLNLVTKCDGNNKQLFIDEQGLPGSYTDLPDEAKRLNFFTPWLLIPTSIIAFVILVCAIFSLLNAAEDWAVYINGGALVVGLIFSLIWVYHMNDYDDKLTELKSYIKPDPPFYSSTSGWGKGSIVDPNEPGPITLGILWPDAIVNRIKIFNKSNASDKLDITNWMNVIVAACFYLITIGCIVAAVVRANS